MKENEEEEVEEGKQWCMPHFDRLQNQVLVPIPREQQPHGIRGEVPEGVRAILHVHYIIEVNLKFCKCCCHGEPNKKKKRKSLNLQDTSTHIECRVILAVCPDHLPFHRFLFPYRSAVTYLVLQCHHHLPTPPKIPLRSIPSQNTPHLTPSLSHNTLLHHSCQIHLL